MTAGSSNRRSYRRLAVHNWSSPPTTCGIIVLPEAPTAPQGIFPSPPRSTSIRDTPWKALPHITSLSYTAFESVALLHNVRRKTSRSGGLCALEPACRQAKEVRCRPSPRERGRKELVAKWRTHSIGKKQFAIPPSMCCVKSQWQCTCGDWQEMINC